MKPRTSPVFFAIITQARMSISLKCACGRSQVLLKFNKRSLCLHARVLCNLSSNKLTVCFSCSFYSFPKVFSFSFYFSL